MEFNDSSVKDYNYSELKNECFGDKAGTQQNFMGFGGWGGKYGKSGYMLFYERRKKKPIRIVVPADQVTEEMKSRLEHDAEKDEWVNSISYREGVDTAPPNKIFKQVNKDNSKFEFENEVYSPEFFENVTKILRAVAAFGPECDPISKQMRKNAMQVARKACFEVVSRCFYNNGIKDMAL
jgi:hypothetical protein